MFFFGGQDLLQVLFDVGAEDDHVPKPEPMINISTGTILMYQV